MRGILTVAAVGIDPPGVFVSHSNTDGRAFTIRPDLWKAHGTAGKFFPSCGLELRPAELFQTNPQLGKNFPKAVLEQPSSSRVTWQTLGRRNIVLLETSELKTPPSVLKVREVVNESEEKCKQGSSHFSSFTNVK